MNLVFCISTKPARSEVIIPQLRCILETALYVDDLARAADFYEGIMGLRLLHADDRLRAYNVNERSVLLLFIRGGTLEPVETEGGLIPPHDGSGALHVAFAVGHAELLEWAAHLKVKGVEIEGESDWKRGGHSIYFRDPDGNLLEIASTPGLWAGF